MSITITTSTIPGSPVGTPNPLPIFRSGDNERPVTHDGTFLPQDLPGFGKNTSFCVLPYRMQESYTRERTPQEIRAIVLENEFLRAELWPEYGGRLVSLYNKEIDRELLFRNPVFQPANLAIRNAWFSGGIEWNVGRFGHSVFTCDSLFAGIVTDEEGNEFVRLWEYERTQRLFFTIDLHLPPGSRHLTASVRIINDNDEGTPLYWWTNIAARQDNRARVFSTTDEVIYIKPSSNTQEGNASSFGRATLPNLPSLPGKDASYPKNFPYSSEYFFQTPPTYRSPWEACGYDDGLLFYERSSAELRYRKMFCWGTQSGGKHWCDYLSQRDKGNYIELQGGLAPSQVHGRTLAAHSEITFTQIFGGTSIPPEQIAGTWAEANARVTRVVEECLCAEQVAEIHARCQRASTTEIKRIIHHGSGWGALELMRRRAMADQRPVPTGLTFPSETIGVEQEQWVELLQDGTMSAPSTGQMPTGYVVDRAWEPLLLRAAEHPRPEAVWPLIHLGIMRREHRDEEGAMDAWKSANEIESTSIAWRNIAQLLKRQGDTAQFIEALRRAGVEDGDTPNEHLSYELLEGLFGHERYEEIKTYYERLPRTLREKERLIVLTALADLRRDDDALFERVISRPLAYVREGETRLVDAWYAREARREAQERGTTVTPQLLQEVRATHRPPENIDFRMS